jgi:hypothetical protein
MSADDFQTYVLNIQFKLDAAKKIMDDLENAMMTYRKPKENTSCYRGFRRTPN